MADDKKPKIDLKSRLNKMGGAPAAGSSPVAIPVPGKSVPPPPAIPIPPGVQSPFRSASSPAPRLDPTNPLAAVAVPFQTGAPAAAPSSPVQHQRIEVDEQHVHSARKGVRNVMLVVAALVGAAGVGIGWLAGGSSAKASVVTEGTNDAHLLAKDLATAKTNMQKLADLVVAAQKQLGAGKYPDTLEKDLTTAAVGFDGKNLGGKRFGGVSADTMKDLVDFITSVQGLEKKKLALRSTLVTDKQAITDYLALQAVKDKTTFKFVITIDRDSLNAGTRILPLATPLTVANTDPLPATLKMPSSSGKTTADVDRFVGAELKDQKPFALLVAPGGETAICGGEAKNALTSITKDMTSFVNDIRAESTDSASGETKVGLSQKADALIETLNHL